MAKKKSRCLDIVQFTQAFDDHYFSLWDDVEDGVGFGYWPGFAAVVSAEAFE